MTDETWAKAAANIAARQPDYLIEAIRERGTNMNSHQMKLNADRAAAKNRLFDLLNGFVNAEDVDLSNSALISVVVQRWTRYCNEVGQHRLETKDNSIMAGIR